MSAPTNLLAEWARLLLGSLAAAGVRDVVISPGSRSTPFVLAAAAEPRLRCHDIIDERSAAFFALGLARATGQPPLLLCTSGTAGAHYFPAVVEAAQAFVPLLVLTADRPFELQDCAAPQTIDQRKLFGDHARASIELGLPDESDGALRALKRQAAQAVYTSRAPLPGAVHLNARARKPLEPPPIESEGPAEHALRERVRAIAAAPLPRAFAPRLAPDPAAVDELARACLGARSGLIVAGPAPIAQAEDRADLLALAARTGFPLLAEATSQLRFNATASKPDATDDASAPFIADAFDALLRLPRFREAHPPDLIIQIGPPPTSGAFDQYLAAHPDTARWVIAPHGWNDPRSDARGLLFAEVGAAARALRDRITALGGPTREPLAWTAMWRAADAIARRETTRLLADETTLSEGAVARAAASSVPAGGLLLVGNSLPIRELDTFAAASDARCAVLSQRGANGIDGLVSGAAGAAASGRPTTLLVGDVSFLHDLGGLVACRGTRVPLVLVVIQNGGGRIFEQLPVARVPQIGDDLRHFTTPHDLRFDHAAALFGLRYARAQTLAELDSALASASSSTDVTIIEAIVPPHGAAAMMRPLQDRIEAALAAEGLA